MLEIHGIPSYFLWSLWGKIIGAVPVGYFTFLCQRLDIFNVPVADFSQEKGHPQRKQVIVTVLV